MTGAIGWDRESHAEIVRIQESVDRLSFRRHYFGLSDQEAEHLDTLELILKSLTLVLRVKQKAEQRKRKEERRAKQEERLAQEAAMEGATHEPVKWVRPNVKRWRDWQSSDSDEPPDLPVCEVEHVPETRTTIIDREMDVRARAMMQWAPWARRSRHASRRYEGFSR